MPDFSQADRPLSVATPLGPDVLLLESFSGVEQISSLFSFQLDLLAEQSNLSAVKFSSLMGKPLTVSIKKADGSLRHINGIVSRFSQGAQVHGPTGGPAFTRFRAEIVPSFWLLQRRSQSRIFQQMNVPDILKAVLTGLDCSYEIQGTFHPRDYCSQFRESDFAFASRLMEEEGIYYYFLHADGSHKMVLANTPSSHRATDPSTAKFEGISGGNRPDDRVHFWEKVQEVRSAKQTLWDHCFEMPDHNLEATSPIQQSVAVGTESHGLKDGSSDALELYDYPGGYAQRFDGIDPGGGDRASDLQKIYEDNKRTASIRMQQEAVNTINVFGSGVCAHFIAGFKFGLTNHYSGNGDYVITSVTHRGTQAGLFVSGAGDVSYQNQFQAIPAALPYRPQRVTPKAVVIGTHAATVVGPSGEEIFTDKYGRVKVQFRWDRQGKNDAGSSCWVRVATLWAGTQWGMIHIPRIGQEVVVAFEEGDPDRPIIIGSVYNAAMMPPYTLPDNRTKSGIKSRSSLQGDDQNFNEIRFEDKKGEEEIYIHAEKDFNRVVENNDTLKVGHEKKDKGNQTVEIFNNRSTSIGTGGKDAADGSDKLDVFNSQSVVIGSGKANAASGSQTVTIYKDRTTTIETGNDTLTISKGNHKIAVSKGKSGLDAAEEILLVTGQSKLTMKKDGTILLEGANLTIKGSNLVEVKSASSSIKVEPAGITISGLKVAIDGKASMDITGGMTTVQAKGICTISGSMTKIG